MRFAMVALLAISLLLMPIAAADEAGQEPADGEQPTESSTEAGQDCGMASATPRGGQWTICLVGFEYNTGEVLDDIRCVKNVCA